MVYDLGMKLTGKRYEHEGKPFLVLGIKTSANGAADGYECYMLSGSGDFVIIPLDDTEVEKINVLPRVTYVYKLDYVIG